MSLSDSLKLIPLRSSKSPFKILQSYEINQHGLICWDATLVAIKYVELLVEHVPETFENRNILELGAGTGAIAIALARFCRERNVETGYIITTDQGVCVPLMEKNIELNLTNEKEVASSGEHKEESVNRETTSSLKHAKVPPNIKARELLWEREDQYPQNVADEKEHVDVLIVCDCVYENINIWKNLLRACWKIMTQDTVLLLIQERRGKKDALFFSIIADLFEIVQVPRDQQDTEYSSDDIDIFWMKKREDANEIDLESVLRPISGNEEVREDETTE